MEEKEWIHIRNSEGKIISNGFLLCPKCQAPNYRPYKYCTYCGSKNRIALCQTKE